LARGTFITDLIAAQWASAMAVPQAAIRWSRARINKSNRHHDELSRLVIIGDSLSASAQLDSTEPDPYARGFAELLAQQAGVELSRPQPVNNAVRTRRRLTRSRPISAAYNLAVAGSKVEDALADSPMTDGDNVGSAASQPGGFERRSVHSQIVWAEKLAPSTVIIWLGNNDVLAGLLGDDRPLLTPLGRFTAAYDEVIRRAAATGAGLVLGNIPDVTRLPCLVSAEETARLTGRSLAELESALGIAANDYVTRQSFDLLTEALSREGTESLPRFVKLTSSEVEKVRSTVGAYNQVIASRAKEYDAALVDIYSLAHNIFRHGLRAGRRLLTTDFLGGMFSLDGIHPSVTGYAVIANEFIRAINERFGSCLSPVNLHKIIMRDPLLSSGRVRTEPGAASADKDVRANSGFSSLVEGEDYYREGSAIVFTEQYHLRRGYCCESRCRHCPFKEPPQQTTQR
jgi:lysophospholipase L1-like esterase